jgi:hypothetical protein
VSVLRRSVVVGAVLVTCAFASSRDAVAQPCDANHLIDWPDANPVWQLCWTSPENSTGIDGSGLEVSSVRYKGHLVLSTGHMPVINVKYDPGGCGGPDLSFRDWGNELVRFEADNVIRPGYAEPTVPPRTVCATPGSDVGDFTGVAAEKLADRLILTTQIQAGWYRYVVSWTFFLDGTFQPGIRFTAVANVCTPLPHYHDVYWRLDFDLDGSENDAVEELNNGVWTTLKTETQRLHSPATNREWRVRDKVTGAAYELVPAADADTADSWGVADLWTLRFRSTEVDDGGATGGENGDQVHLDRYVNGEAIDGQDVVLWYRTGFRHVGSADCELGGPTLRPTRTPSINVTANGQDLPLTVSDEPLRIDISFDAAGASSINPSEFYLGVLTPFGTYFVDSTLHFVPFRARLYTGPLGSFPPSLLVNFPSANAVLPPGTYVWFVVVDGDANGVIDGTFYDYVVTTVGP